MLRVQRWIVLVLFAVALASCGKDSRPTSVIDPGGAEVSVLAGLQALAAGDIAGANAHFRAALAKDPSNPKANLGAAVTEVYLVESDPQVRGILARLGLASLPTKSGLPPSGMTPFARVGLGTRGSYGPLATGRALFGLLITLADDPPAVSEIQQVLKTAVMPRLLYAETRLNVIEGQPRFVWKIPPAMTGAPDTAEIDLGDILLLDAVVNNIQACIGVLVAYNFDMPYAAVNAESLLAEGTAFGRLHPDGAAQLAAARGNLLIANARLKTGIASILAETDDQSDDVIPRGALDEPDFQRFASDMDLLAAALEAPVTVQVSDYLGNPVDLVVHLEPFFTNPILDLKSKLPAHAFDPSTGDPVISDPLEFPDPEFNGIFPGMTNAGWQQLIGPLPPLASR